MDGWKGGKVYKGMHDAVQRASNCFGVLVCFGFVSSGGGRSRRHVTGNFYLILISGLRVSSSASKAWRSGLGSGKDFHHSRCLLYKTKSHIFHFFKSRYLSKNESTPPFHKRE